MPLIENSFESERSRIHDRRLLVSEQVHSGHSILVTNREGERACPRNSLLLLVGEQATFLQTMSYIKSVYVTVIPVQINLPEICILKIQNPIVLIVINRT